MAVAVAELQSCSYNLYQGQSEIILMDKNGW